MRRIGLLTGAFLGAIVLLTTACRSPQSNGGEAVDQEEPLVALMPIDERGGAQLWGDNCGRCHNTRTPTEFSDRQWEVIAHHMRVRANLTAYEYETIIQFLKSAN